MRILKFSFFILVSLIFSNSCSNELDITAEPRDIPIVYGVLAANAPAHFVRVERAFIDPDIGPLDLAQEPDLLFYENATVEILNLDTEERFTLERIDATLEGFPREDGIFATDPNIIYRIDGSRMPLVGGENLQLQINRGENLDLITAETTIIPPMDITRPILPMIRAWTNEVEQRISWKPNSEDTQLFDIEIVLNYDERVNTPGSPTVSKSISFFPVRNRRISDTERGNTQLTNEVDGGAFFQFVGQAIDGTIPAIRAARGIDFIVHGGGTEIERFFTITLANSGITSSQDVPVFTNISGGGQGIFSTRSVGRFNNIQLEDQARDSLLNGRFTSDLNFQ